MNKSISCPRCGEPNDLEASNCDHCGVNLGLSAILVEQQLKDQTDFSKELRLSPEVLVPRLGEYLIERKLLSSDDLIEALEYQKKMNELYSPYVHDIRFWKSFGKEQGWGCESEAKE